MKRLIVILIFFLSHSCLAVTPWDASAISKAVAQGAWENSENLLRDLKTKDIPEEQQKLVDYNLGVSLYSQEKFEEALPFFEAASKVEDDDELKAKALYNQGNSFFRLERIDEAKTSYQDALLTDPNDDDSRYNLEVIQEKEKEKQDEEDKKDQSDKDEDKEDQDKKDQSDKDKNEQEKKDADKDKNQQNEDQNDQKNQDQEEQQSDQKNPQNQEPEMTEAEKKAAQEEAERARLLDYFKQQEKEGRPATAVQPQAAPVRGKTW